MKTTIPPTFSRSLTQAMTALLLLTSACDQGQGAQELVVDREAIDWPSDGEGEPTEAQTLAHSKEIVISDGHNEVTLLVASDDPKLIEGYDDDSFEIVPVFERPEVPESEGGSGDDKTLDTARDSSDSVLIEERSVSLEGGAIGYELRPTPPVVAWDWSCGSRRHVSTADFVSMEVLGGPCTSARISNQQFGGSYWVESNWDPGRCAGEGPFVGGSASSAHVQLRVCPGPKRIIFFN